MKDKEQQLIEAAEKCADLTFNKNDHDEYYWWEIRRDGFIAGHKEAAKQYHQQSEWISISERLPECHTKVIIYYNDNQSLGIYDELDEWNVFYSNGLKTENPANKITHWMPLPEPPKNK